ncbi:MAG TPA: Gfo/Idh/MocA family oxidoreductase [Bryobacteraceae bacterium]|nr:Gfo/Idh/MocA family oxidoreductase [Bryobacteraceae bacterium]
MATRREFLGAAAGLGIALPALAANDRIQIAIIGAGGMGQGDVKSSLAAGGKLVAAADVYQGRLTRCQEVWGKDVFITRDYREVLARPDVDAVIVATPDHWHQQISIDAMNAGKDVYCEKPMTQRLDDGLTMVAAQQKTGRILQVGSQRVSSILYQKARDLYHAGAIGELNLVEAWWDRNSAIGAWQYSIPPDATEANIDWDRFLGRAPKRPFEARRLFRWRNYRDYGTGVAGDLFVHLLSGMHFVTGVTGPTRVYATGGLRFWKDGRDVPDVMLAFYDYPGFNLALHVNFVDGGQENEAFRFIGSDGTMTISKDVTVSKVPRESEPGYTIGTFAQATQDEFLKRYFAEYPKQTPNADSIRPQDDQHFSAPAGYSDHRDHHRNFLNAVRTRKPVVEDAQFGFRASGPALLANMSYFERRICEWDPEAMKLK